MEKVKRVNLDGPPGTGKSSRLTRLFIAAAEELGPKKVGAVTFTRSAAEVLRQRAGEALNLGKVSHVLRRLLPYVGTVHSIVYQTLGHPKLVGGKELDEFCDYMNLPQVRGVPNDPDDLDGFWTPEDAGHRPGVGMMLRVLSASRHRGVPIREVVPDLVPPTLTALYRPDWFESLAQKYTAWKRDSGLLDYDDLLDAGKKLTLPVSVLLCDECQPPGTEVWTPKGAVPIESVSPGDVVSSYDRKALYLSKSTVESVRTHLHGGHLVRVTCGGRASRYTPEHHCVVKMGGAFAGKAVLYLMRRRESYRVGMTSSNHGRKSGGTAGVKGRLLEEGADDVWVLDVFDNKMSAHVQENLVSARFGIPQVQFRQGNYAGAMSQDYLDEFWTKLGPNESQARACLEAFGRDIQYPLASKGKTYLLYGRATVVRACNLIDGMDMLNVADRTKGYNNRFKRTDKRWTPIKVTKEPYSGLVYSLSVARTHTYIADGLVTHNCQDNSPLMWEVMDAWAVGIRMAVFAGDAFQAVFRFSGANPDLFLNHPGEWGYLTVSHRLDDASAAYSHDVLRAGGWDLGDKKPVRGGGRLRADGSTLLLARTNSLVGRLEDEQARVGEPYLLLGRYSPWTSLTADAYRVMSTLRNGGVIRASQLQAMVKAARPGALSREAVASLSRLSSGERVVTAGDVARVMSLDSYAAKNPDVWSYMERVERKHGYTSIYSRPKVLIGTIHKAKGMEADEVVLLQDWGVLPAKVASVRGDGSRSEACVAYVATTRHRGRLTVRYLGDTPPYPFPRRKDDAA